MVGATPQLATAVWVGTVENTPLFNEWGGNMYGSLAPSVIWKDTMDTALEDEDIEEFPTARPLGYGNAPSYNYWAPSAPSSGSGTGTGTGTGDTGDGTSTTSPATPEGSDQTPAPGDAPAPAPAPEAPAPEAPAEDTGDIELAPGIVIPGDLLNLG